VDVIYLEQAEFDRLTSERAARNSGRGARGGGPGPRQ
jgi:hypothetical protein